MNKSILWIVDGWKYWDKTNGNSYHLTCVTHVRTRNSVIFDSCTGNVCSAINKADRKNSPPADNSYQPSRYHLGTIEDISYRQWRRMLNSQSYSPVSVYKRTSHGVVTNETVNIINRLRRVTK